MNNLYATAMIAQQHQDRMRAQAQRERLVRSAPSTPPELVDLDARVRRTRVIARLALVATVVTSAVHSKLAHVVNTRLQRG